MCRVAPAAWALLFALGLGLVAATAARDTPVQCAPGPASCADSTAVAPTQSAAGNGDVTAEAEAVSAAAAADPRACGVDGVTYPTVAAAEAAGVDILNCGPCGDCSNDQDVAVYARTASNLTDLARTCSLLPTASWQESCLQRIGFTAGCATCFSRNIQCDRERCLRPCVMFLLQAKLQSLSESIWRLLGAWHPASGAGAAADGPGWRQEALAHNDCLACDEARCGRDFMECAGANRRRAGIVSDIRRPGSEVCAAAVQYRKSAAAAAAAAVAPQGP